MSYLYKLLNQLNATTVAVTDDAYAAGWNGSLLVPTKNAIYDKIEAIAPSGVIGIASGGTGQTTANAGFNALSPMTTGGDLIYGGASGVGTRLANGSAGQFLASAGGTSAPAWTTTLGVANGGTNAGAFTVGSIVFAGTSGTYTQDNANLFYDDTNNQLLLGDGTVTNPSIGFKSDPDTGIYWTGSGQLRFSINGTNSLSVFASSIQAGSGSVFLSGNGTASAPSYAFGSNTTAGLYRISVGVLGISTASTERMRIDASGLIGINGAATGAQVQITNSTAGNIVLLAKGAASQSGSLQEWQNSSATVLASVSSAGKIATQAGTSAVLAKVGGTIFDHIADAGNSGTSETDLYSDTLAANTFATNADKVEGNYGGIFVSSATATRQVKVKFGPSGSETTILDTGALSISTSSSWSVYVLIQRVSSTVVRYTVGLQTSGASTAVYNATGEITGLTLSNAQVLKLTGQAAGVGAATDDIVAKLGYGEFKPSF